MGRIAPDMTVFKEMQDQPEFSEETWQYINRRVSDWRIIAGKEALRKHTALFAKIEHDFGVERGTLLALWGVEFAYGDPQVQQNHMRPVFPALAALAWNAPRRRPYWQSELINALRIVEHGWSTPQEMRGSWAGAMGHTQWMPEVWLNVGMDYDGDGKVSPFGKPDDALGSTARYLVNRGKYQARRALGLRGARRGRLRPATAAAMRPGRAPASRRADGQAFPQPDASAQFWVPVDGGPAFLLGPNFYAVRSYNPVDELCAGDLPSRRPHPGRAAVPAAVPRLRARADLGRGAGNADSPDQGRLRYRRHRRPRRQRHHGCREKYQLKAGIEPADGYGGLKVLARLRQGG